MSPQQQQMEDTSSENTKQNDGCSSSNNSVSANNNNGVVSEEEQCQPPPVATVVQEHDSTDNSDGPSSILSSTDAKPLDTAVDEMIVDGEKIAAITTAMEEQAFNASSEQQHGGGTVETIISNHDTAGNKKDGEEAKQEDDQLFLHYSQQDQSISSESLVQLEEHLKQPVLTENDHHVDGDGNVESVGKASPSSSLSSEADTTEMEPKEESAAVVIAALAKDEEEHAKIIDNEKNKKATTENIDGGTVDGESSTQSSQKSNNNDASTSNQARSTTTFISQDSSASMSPLLQELSASPTPPNLHQYHQHQQQQQHLSSPLHHHHYHQGNNNNNNVISSPSRITYASPPGRRTIKLRLLEEIPSSLPSPQSSSSRNLKTPFKPFRQIGRIRSLSLTGSLTFPYLNEGKSSATTPEKGTTATTSSSSSTPTTIHHDPNGTSDNHTPPMLVMDRGTITVSWYDGTTSSEMQEHVFGCVLRKLNQSGGGGGGSSGGIKLEDVRLLDENVEPHEEVVLCPFLPDGSQFLLRFRTVETKKPERPALGTHNNHNNHTANLHRHPFASRAPDSPSAEPSPHPSNANLVSLGGIHPQQLQVLNAAAAALLRPPPVNLNSAAAAAAATAVASSNKQRGMSPPLAPQEVIPENSTIPAAATTTTAEERTDILIEQQLRQLNELFLQRRSGAPQYSSKSNPEERNDLAEEEQKYHREEKKQVIFLIGNYLILFMSLIALSAEIQSRLPQMMKWVQENYDSVQNCATDRDALVDCLSKGDFSGLVASFVLWATQSVAAKRVFLFGFDTPKKLWTVVYEALVSAVCWGISYLFIRRGLNPNTRQNFVHKYWKDAVYGSLAGFNAAFLKAILKNLVPQDVALEALEGRQLRIFHWLGQLLADE